MSDLYFVDKDDPIDHNWANAIVRRLADHPTEFVPGGDLVAIELKTSLTPGASATGWKLTWNPSTHEYPPPDYESEADVTVYDQIGFRSLGYDDTAEGQGGAILFVNENNSVVSGQQQAKMVRCQAIITSGHTLDTVDNVEPMDGGQSPVTSSSATLTMTFSGTYETDNNAWGVATWDETNDVWRPLDFPCPA